MSEHRFINDQTIPDGLPIKAMRYLIENQGTLQYEGDIFVGTGNASSVSAFGETYTYFETTNLLSESVSNPNAVLCYGTSGFEYRLLTERDFDTSTFSSFLIDPSLALSTTKLRSAVQADMSQFNKSVQYPYAGDVMINYSIYSYAGLCSLQNSTPMLLLYSWGDYWFNMGYLPPHTSSLTTAAIVCGIDCKVSGSQTTYTAPTIYFNSSGYTVPSFFNTSSVSFMAISLY